MDVSLSELREMVMDREVWRAVIHGVAKSRTRLSDWTELNWTEEQAKLKAAPDSRADSEYLEILLGPDLEHFFHQSEQLVNSFSSVYF